MCPCAVTCDGLNDCVRAHRHAECGMEKSWNRVLSSYFVPRCGIDEHDFHEMLLKRSVAKRLYTLPLRVHKTLAVLTNDVRDTGPVQPVWQNDSTLSPTEYHGHGGISWVACWRHEKQHMVIAVYDGGRRETAPYSADRM